MTTLEPTCSDALRCRTVAFVGVDADSLHDQLAAAVDADVVLIESTAHAYATVKRTRPDLILLWLSGDCLEGCQLLSMLALDRDTARIPVVTCVPEQRDPSLQLIH